MKFDLADLWLEYLGSLSEAEQGTADFKGFMDWCVAQSTASA